MNTSEYGCIHHPVSQTSLSIAMRRSTLRLSFRRPATIRQLRSGIQTQTQMSQMRKILRCSLTWEGEGKCEGKARGERGVWCGVGGPCVRDAVQDVVGSLGL